MLRDYRAVRAVATQIAEAADITIEGYRAGKVTDEPHITDRLLATIEEKVRKFVTPSVPVAVAELPVPTGETNGLITPYSVDAPRIRSAAKEPEHGLLVWEAATLRTGPGVAAEEKAYGADILGVLSIDTPEYNVDKGFLAQAKRAEPGVPLSTKEWRRLSQQCEAMLRSTRDAYVAVYSKKWV